MAVYFSKMAATMIGPNKATGRLAHLSVQLNFQNTMNESIDAKISESITFSNDV